MSAPGFVTFPQDTTRLGIRSATSVDHHMQFHDLEAWDGKSWLLYETDSAYAAAGRSHVTGRMWDVRTGALVVSCSQATTLVLEPDAKLLSVSRDS